MKAPFPWFGGKSLAAHLIWKRFGDVVNYVEPFAGSLAVLLARPHWPFNGTHIETINDKDAYVANFWRALQADPDGVAKYADNPVNEVDLHARHNWIHQQAERVERMQTDPDFYDVRIAGYWAWGLSCWIGSNFCKCGKGVNRQLPHLGNAGKGVNRQLPHLGNAGKGVNRQLPHLGNASNASTPGGCADRRERLIAYFRLLADRLRCVRVCCGDWTRIMGPSVTYKNGITGILLDPPYDVDGVCYRYNHVGLSSAVREWAVKNGDNPLLRIALCGYVDEGHVLPGWECVTWRTRGGYNSYGDGKNIMRERIWFSPACLKPDTQKTLFEVGA